MKENVLLKLRSYSETDALALTYYLYQLCIDKSSFSASDENVQILFNELVDRLGLQEHLESVLNVFLQKFERTKELVPMEVSPRYKNPFNFKIKLKINYREDEII